jgi:hypothetical protein
MLISRLLVKVDPEMVISLTLRRMFRSEKLEIESELETEKLDFISQHTKPGGTILEFGSGGSTLELLNRGFQVTSVETDRFFANQVNRVAHSRFNSRPVVFLNIGPTGNYGYPATTLKWINHSMGRFRRYINYPAKKSFDTVIIDGRFRVAAFLSCVKNMEPLPNLIVIDDFLDRPEYQILNKYINFKGSINGMQYFFPKTKNSHADLDKCLAEFSVDPR